MNDARNAFSRAKNLKYRFEATHFHGEITRVAGSAELYEAVCQRNIDGRHWQPVRVTASGLAGLVAKLQSKFGAIRLIKTVADSDFDRNLEESREQVRAEKFSKAPTVSQEQVQPETRLFGFDLRDKRGHDVATHEAAIWVSRHQNDPDFNFSAFNQQNLGAFLTYLMESGQISSPTVDTIEPAYQWLVAHGYWEPRTYKRGHPRAKTFTAPKVEPPPTPEQIYEQAVRTVEPYLSSLIENTAQGHRARMWRLAAEDPEKLKAYVADLLEADRLRKIPLSELKTKYASTMAARAAARKGMAQ